MIRSTSSKPHWNEAEIRAAIPAAVASYAMGREHSILGDIDADNLARDITAALESRDGIADLMTVYEWRLEEIRKYCAAWDAGELPAHKALDGIAYTLSSRPHQP